MANEVYSLTNWLQGKVAITISDEAINSICFDRTVEPTTACEDVEVKTRELCLADLYMYCATLPTTTATIQDKNGNWEHKEGSVTISTTDKKQYRLLARRIYEKYGEVVPSVSSVKFISRGMSNRNFK